LEDDGTRKRDKEGNPLPPLFRLEALHASDVVDEGDATSGLLSVDTLPDWPARQASAVLDKVFGDAPEDVIAARVGDFLNRYLSNRRGEDVAENDNAPPATG